MSRYAIKFPFRVRIHGGEFDESARAIHREDGLKTIQAESGIVLESTIERKQMSTKTTFKRIALVTVAALGFGMMSVAPSSAANTVLIFAAGDGTNPADNATGNGVAGPFNYVTVTVDGVANSVVTSTTKMTNVGTAADLIVAADGLSAEHNGTSNTFRVATPVAGTVTVQYWTRTAGVLSATAAETVTITVNATAQSGVVSAANSTSYLVKGESNTAQTNVAAAADVAVTASASAATTAAVATIKLVVKDALKAAANDSLTATITSPTGAGSIASAAIGSTPAVTGSTAAVSAAADTAGAHNFYVYANGFAGVATITIKAGTTVVATETVTFTGAASTYAAALGTLFGGSSFQVGTNTGALKVTAKDAAGNLVVDGSTVYAFSGTAATATIAASATTTSGVATFDLTGVAAGSSVITFGNASTVAASTVTTTSTVAVTGSVATTVSWAFDKDTYEPGEKMTLTVSAVDANGKPVADGARALFSGVPVSNFSFSNTSVGDALVASPVLLGGKATYALYAPATSGKLTLTATEGTATASTTKAVLTLSATVANPALTAAQEATDAANEATDAGNNAKDAADQAIEAADAATIAAQDAAAAAEAAGAMAVEAAEAAGAIAQDALDAANAATDAALSAAEAADAATAAATEAKESADAATAAVAELSTKVATLMASLNAKVTTLSNLVAKIAKKVKA